MQNEQHIEPSHPVTRKKVHVYVLSVKLLTLVNYASKMLHYCFRPLPIKKYFKKKLKVGTSKLKEIRNKAGHFSYPTQMVTSHFPLLTSHFPLWFVKIFHSWFLSKLPKRIANVNFWLQPYYIGRNYSN